LFKGIRKLPPATVLVIAEDGSRKQEKYWQPGYDPEPGEQSLSADDWKERIETELRAAVRRRLVADVPVGVLLSGGLDSSLIVGLLAEAGATGLNTFSIGFETVGEEKGDEFEYSDIVAQHFGTRHHQIPVETSRALPALSRAIGAMSEPMTSHDCVGFYLLSEEVSKHVKVVQSGQGADEIFAGYHWYPPMVGANDPVATYKKAFFDRDQVEMAKLIPPEILADDPSTEFVRRHFADNGASEPVDKALRLDSHIMLVDDPVKRVDNMTMAHGLEARVPFLDHELVEVAARCPADLKMADGGKGVLKTIARDHIPAAVIDRPKGYFPMPALKYLRGPYLEMVRDAVNSATFRDRGLVNPDYVETLLKAPEDHITPLRGSKLWQVGVLALWLDQHDKAA
jgi:asparagine synthase (glutamine-hydrolysing)